MTSVPSPAPAAAPRLDIAPRLDAALRLAVWRRILSFPAAGMALLLGLVFARARYGIADPDIWWHLRDAAALFARHALPRADAYSFTLPGGAWINTEWLAEIPYYLAWRAAGLVGVEWCSLLLLAAIFLGLWYLCWKECGNSKAALLACVLAAPLCMVSFGPRTILPGYLLLLALLALLQRLRQTGRAPLWLLPPLFCLWINTHGSWSLGVTVFALLAGAGMVRRPLGPILPQPWSFRQLRGLAVAAAASAAALLVNPYGYRMALYPLDIAFRQKLNIAHIEEWSSVDFHTPRGKMVLLLLVALLLGAMLKRHRWTVPELALGLFALYSGLTYTRFLFLAALLVAPLAARLLANNSWGVPRYRPEVDRPGFNALIIAAVAVGMVWAHPTAARTGQALAAQYPVALADSWRVHAPAGRVLNYYLWGGYLGWRDPGFRDFIDSRVDLFEYAGVFKDYLDLAAMKDPAAILDKYGIQYVLFPPGEPLSGELRRSAAWRMEYADGVCQLFERRSAAPAPIFSPPAAAGERPW